MIIGVDAVGGDYYPNNPVEGALEALRQDSGIEILLFGRRSLVEPLLDRVPDGLAGRIRLVDAPDVIGMDEPASSAVKSKTSSSITVGLHAHKAGECHAFVSAGNTGALLAASTVILGRLEGVLRPTIGTVYPTLSGFRLLVDAGANLEPRPEHYPQFARMGMLYVKELMGVENPKVGLLNVGEEPEKGTETLRLAYNLLRGLPEFVGNVEGRDIFPAKADVFLSDGLVGNLLLKFGESIPDAVFALFKQSVVRHGVDQDTVAILKTVMADAFQPFNYENVGGVPFLGVNGVSMVGHGGSTPKAICNMILNAARCVRQELNHKIVKALSAS